MSRFLLSSNGYTHSGLLTIMISFSFPRRSAGPIFRVLAIFLAIMGLPGAFCWAGEYAPQSLLDEVHTLPAEIPAQTAQQRFGQTSGPAMDHDPVYRGYRLGAGDVLQITVYGEDDLSGSYRIGPDGTIAMPLIGTMTALGHSAASLQDSITSALADGYLRAPDVSVELMQLRPYFIMGEVRQPGSYPYTGGMTALNAVAVAGGFTYRADEDEVKLLRPSEDAESYRRIRVTETIYPGDIIVVEERFF